jgi:XTP/dITP diphosphohydrolase
MKSKTSTASDNQEAFQRLSDILDTLRKECPWDKAQTMKSLRYLTIEEVHELSEAIVAQSPDEIKKELGDLAMHILFYCKVAEDEGLFSTTDVYNAICDKLIARHPFIYDKENYHGENWEQLKMREGRKNVLEGVPYSLPTLVKTVRMQEKVSGKSGFSENTEDPGMSEEEFGQKLFDLVDWGRRHGINADDALCLANRRFKEQHS